MSDANIKSVSAAKAVKLIECGKVFSSRAERSLVAISNRDGKLKLVRTRARASYRYHGKRQFIHDAPHGYLCSGESGSVLLSELRDL
jgi:hypothetical protein